jgi:MFS family permease
MLNKLKNIRNLRTFSSLKNRAYRIYFTGMFGQWTSMNMQTIARSYLIYHITGSGSILGLSALANAIPTILVSLPGGALADRVQKKTILFYTLLGSMLVSLTVGICISVGYLGPEHPDSWWVLIVAAAVQGTFMGLMMPARQSIIPELVNEDQIMNAVSLNMMGTNSLRILAPAATGFLIEGVGYQIVYFIISAMYGLGALCMILVPRTTSRYKGSGNAFRDIADGMKYLAGKKTIMLVIIATLFVMLCGIPFMQLMPMITEDILHVGESGMGILMSLSGAGAIVGSIILASTPGRKRGLIMIVAGCVMGLALLGFAFSRWWALSIVMVIFIGLGQTSHRTSGNALVQTYTEAEYRGRVMSFMMMELGFSSLGTFFAGLLADAFGVQWAIGGLAIALVIMSVIFATTTSRLRKLE